jgi:hypothetical protein
MHELYNFYAVNDTTDKAFRTQELWLSYNRHAWQYTVFAAEFDARDSEEKFYRV